MVHRVFCSNGSPDVLSSFRYLRHVELCYDMDRRDLDDFFSSAGFYHGNMAVLPFFYIFQVQDLRVVMPERGDGLRWPCEPAQARSLTNLTLHRSGIEPAVLGELLQITPSLRHLTYDYCPEMEHGIDSVTYLHNDHLSAALENVSKTLETLVICVQLWQMSGTDYGMQDFQSAISGSASFTSLAEL